MRPLGLNLGRYLGERTDLGELLLKLGTRARNTGWQEEVLLPGTDRELFCYHRPAESRFPSASKFYLSAGIHGDEPAGPLALLRLLESDLLPRNAHLWICPCLNPTGCTHNTRENDAGIDLNRDYLRPVSAEVQAHIAWLESQPVFDAALCLHEDWEANGFYCYELNPPDTATVAEATVAAVGKICPIETAPIIDGRPAHAPGIIRPSLDPASRPQWPEALWLLQHRAPRSLTLEAPSDFPLALRERALMIAVTTALNLLNQSGKV